MLFSWWLLLPSDAVGRAAALKAPRAEAAAVEEREGGEEELPPTEPKEEALEETPQPEPEAQPHSGESRNPEARGEGAGDEEKLDPGLRRDDAGPNGETP